MYGYLAAGVALAAAIAYGLYERGNAASAVRDRDIARVEKAAAEADRDRAVSANAELEKTVTDLQEANLKSNRIVARMVAEQDATQQAISDLRREIAESNDEPTRDFLVIPVPDYLGMRLNR